MLHEVSFDTTDWTEQWHDATDRGWQKQMGDGLSLHFFPLPPDIPTPLDQLDDLRQFYRSRLAAKGGGILALDTIIIDSVVTVKMLVKMPQAPSGMIYLGSLTIPRRDFSFVIKIQCQEYGVTGMRDAAVWEQAMAKGQIHIDEAGTMIGWAADPYDPSFTAGTPRNLADDEQYDALFPDHPLSRLRQALALLEPSIRLSDAVKTAPPFAGPIVPTPKPWWKRW